VGPRLLVNRTVARAIVSCLSAPRSAEAHPMDPRNTPGYRLHRALSQLKDLEGDQLTDADRERIETATALLEEVSLLTRPGCGETADTHTNS